MTNEEYIRQNSDKDVRSLALSRVPDGIDLQWCLRQIEGKQLAKKKLHSWYEAEGLWYPPRLSMEQCSSDATAAYKSELIDKLPIARKLMADLTGGFGVDFSFMANKFEKAIYVERQPELCNVACHNFPLLGLKNAQVVNAECETFLNTQANASRVYSLIYLDPARRDTAGRKVYGIEDCTPDLTELQERLLSISDVLMVKLSPMLDITQALRTLRSVRDVHIVSVRGECKELLFILSNKLDKPLEYHCVNLETEEKEFVAMGNRYSRGEVRAPMAGHVLLEPNASIMKAGLQDVFAEEYSLYKPHVNSNVFFADESGIWEHNTPARKFRVVELYDFSKQSLKRLQGTVKQANITIRNFPSSVADLRKRLKIKDGGNEYLFVTTLADGSHVILRCSKI